MKSNRPNIFGQRLKMARKKAGLSLQGLAELLENTITKQALSKYENGLMNPSQENLLAIADILKLKPDYFLKASRIKFGEIQFRKKARLSIKEEESIVETVRDYLDRFKEVEDILGIQSFFQKPDYAFQISDYSDVELFSNKLRIDWNLGQEPIPNLVHELEERGCRIVLLESSDNFDGLAVETSDHLPVIAVNTSQRSIERIRFTIVHELAHIILPFSKELLNNDKLVEKFCHYFASNFLLPKDFLVNHIGGKRSYIRIEELIQLKSQFGISIRAIVYRLNQIFLISDTYYRRWIIYMSKTYGKKNEPGEYTSVETSSILEGYVNRALSKNLLSLTKAAYLIKKDLDWFRKTEPNEPK